ncbi:MAG: penicillin-binding transpeptidase domain-containing protein [Rhodothermaceae bacterium]
MLFIKTVTKPKTLIFIIISLFIFGCKHRPDLSIYFKDTEGCFVFFDTQDSSYQRYNSERCAKRFTPCSTFKIPNTLIALDSKLFSNPDSIVTWDSTKNPPLNYWPSSWKRDNSLRTALQNSVVWFYQEIARKTGKEKYKDYLNKINYGNKNLAGPIDKFWLSSSLQISADEQIEFLKKFYSNKLGFSEEHTELTKELLVLEDTGVYTLYGKTGAGSLPNGNFIGWLVGYVENDKGISFYALNIEGKTFSDISAKRIKLAKKLLKAVEALPRAYQ